MSLSDTDRTRVADLLAEAERTRVAIRPLVQLFPGIDVVDSYEIQLLNIRRRLAAGARVHGHKVGLSSKAMQDMMGVDEPDYGHLLDDMALTQGTPVAASHFLLPRVEVEVGFILGADLPGEGCTVEDVLRCTEAVAPAIELIDSRIADWKIGLPDTIADNASSAGYVLGEARVKPSDIDVRAIDATLTLNGEQVAAGCSDAVLGNPAWSVAWLARTVARFGVRLEAGHVVLPGSCTRAYDVRAGDVATADFAGLGTVSLTFK
jgi:2-keto-4-pentenoate hydratase